MVLTLDTVPWHRGAVGDAVWVAQPHLHLYRLPRYRPQRHVIERFWRVLRRRATHNRLCSRMVKKLMQLRVRSISRALRAVHGTAWDLYTLRLG